MCKLHLDILYFRKGIMEVRKWSESVQGKARQDRLGNIFKISSL